MAYQRKSRNSEELSELCRKASMSRKSFKGGRKKKYEDRAKPSKSVSIRPDDYDELFALSREIGDCISGTIHALIVEHRARSISEKDKE